MLPWCDSTKAGETQSQDWKPGFLLQRPIASPLRLVTGVAWSLVFLCQVTLLRRVLEN